MHLSRRQLLQIGGVSLLSSLPVLAARTAEKSKSTAIPKGKAKACIILFQVGGPYQCDTFDPKPSAPADIRGPFKPIATNVTGIRFTEALPRIAQHADKMAIIRSVHHTIRCHNPAIYCSLAGREATDAMAVSNRTNAKRTDHPHYASVVARQRPGVASMPSHVVMPDHVVNGPAKTPGILAGYLGAKYDPLILGADPSAADFRFEGVTLPADMQQSRLGGRQTLLQQLDQVQREVEKTENTQAMDVFYEKAFSVLTSTQAKQAFDLSLELPKLRDRYGRHTSGQGALLARRLVEAGVPFVTVFSHVDVDKGSWDTHQQHYKRVPDLLPPADQSFSALLEDMSTRGLLDDVLVVWMGEFGRTPRMGISVSNNTNNTEGRDHWCNCYSVALAGGGVRGGRIIGSSDFIGGYPKERPVHISDLAATIYAALGVDPRSQLYDIQGQLRFICDGNPVEELF